MLTLPRAIEMLNGINYSCLPAIAKWQEIYYRTSIHTTGVCPRFYPLRDGGVLGDSYIEPTGWLGARDGGWGERYDYIFDTFLLNKHAREPEVTRQWRKSVYRPYQMDPLLECIGATSACIFGDSKYTLIIEDKDDSDYINGNNFDGKTFIGYFQWMFKAICEDPNSIFVVVPKEAGYATTTKKVEPQIIHIPSRYIYYISDTEIIYYQPYTNYAWLVNELGYFRFEKQNDKWFPMDANIGYYAHLLTYKPAHFAGGIWNTHKYYDSYLKPAQAYCDDFVSAHSDVQMINKEASHPFIQAASSDCPACNGLRQDRRCTTCGGSDTSCSCDTIDNIHLVDCTTCRGSGKQTYNPADWMIVPPDQMGNDLIKVVEFNVSTNEYLDKHAETILLGIKKSLHQHYVEEAQSGVAKEIDRSGQYLFRSMVCDGVWSLIEKCLIDVLSIRNTSVSNGIRKPEPPKYILVKPTDFDLKTENDLLDEYKNSTEAKTPEWVRQKQVEQYVDKIFGGDDAMKRKAALINEMDAFSVTSITDKTALLAASGISPKDFQFSNVLPKILDKILRERGKQWFVTADYDLIETEVNAIFAAMPPLEMPVETTEVKVNA